MTSERSQAYGRVVKSVDDLAGSKLHPTEQQTIRDAADALFFCEDLGGDREAQRALRAVEELVDALIDAERFTPEAAGRILDDVVGCGPVEPSIR